MDVLNAAYKLDDLRSPPGNRLEVLKGDLEVAIIVFVSMTNGELLSAGMAARRMFHW